MIREKLNIRTLSPIHIGNGNKITKFEYILEGESLTVYSLDKLISFLPEEKINELTKILEQGENIDRNLIQPYLNKVRKYTILTNIRKFNTHKEIYEFIKTYENKKYKPYIPTSELKGTIRTAILYKILKDNWDNLKDLVSYEKNGITFLKDNSSKILEKNIFGDVKNDVMKFFSIADSKAIGNQNLNIEEIKIVNSSKKFTEYAECLKENTLIKDLKIQIDKINPEVENPMLEKHSYKNYLLNWKSCAYEYSKDLIIVEKDYWQNRNTKILSFLEKIEVQNTKETPTLRIGRFTGKLSHTIIVFLKIQELNKKLKVDKKIFPKTRRITSNDELLGWIKFEKIFL